MDKLAIETEFSEDLDDGSEHFDKPIYIISWRKGYITEVLKYI